MLHVTTIIFLTKASDTQHLVVLAQRKILNCEERGCAAFLSLNSKVWSEEKPAYGVVSFPEP